MRAATFGLLLFASAPLLVSLGDTARYWPLFTLLFALFLRHYINVDRLTVWGCSLLGIMYSTSLLGPSCCFRLSGASVATNGIKSSMLDLAKGLPAFVLFGCMGFRASAALVWHDFGTVASGFSETGFLTLGRNLLRFFGGLDLESRNHLSDNRNHLPRSLADGRPAEICLYRIPLCHDDFAVFNGAPHPAGFCLRAIGGARLDLRVRA